MPFLTNQRTRFLGGGRKWYTAGGAPLPVAAYQPIGAASLAASYVNLANPGTYNAAPGVASPALAVGVLAVAGQQGYRNGVAEGTPCDAWDTVSDKPIYILCRNNNGTPGSIFTGTIAAVAIYSSALSAAQVAAVSAAMAALA